MKHKVFISYHHESDVKYRNLFEKLFSQQHDICDSLSIKEGEIGNVGTDNVRRITREKHLKESTVTIVLIGRDTWRRKHVDYEIYNTLRSTQNNTRSGLLGIILPSYHHESGMSYNPRTIPKRLYQNIENKYAAILHWTEDAQRIQNFIHEAFLRRKTINPNNSLPLFKNNQKGEYWS